MRAERLLGAIGAVMGLAGVASAGSILVTGTSGSRQASALFETSGTSLVVRLTNTSSADALVPTDILTGVFFDIAGSPLSLGRTSAVLGAGAFVHNGAAEAGGVVGGEWAYRGGLSGAPHGADYGISSSGLGLFGPGDRFPGANLAGPTSPGGVQFGITTAGDNLATGNGGIISEGLIKSQVVFTLSGLPVGFNPESSILNVSFQYGTDLSEPNVPQMAVVPLPSAGALGLAGLGALAARRRRR